MRHALAGMLKGDTATGDRTPALRVIPALLLLLALMVLTLPARGQRRLDIGFLVAVPWYQGDLSTIVPQPTAVPPAVGPILRYNFNQRQSLRAHVMAYKLEGSG